MDYKKLIGDIDDLLIAHPSENVSKMYLRKAADAIKQLITNAESLPAADVVPVRHGRWLCGDYYDIGDVCSECDWDSQMAHPSYRYCPNCGAKMDEVSE